MKATDTPAVAEKLRALVWDPNARSWACPALGGHVAKGGHPLRWTFRADDHLRDSKDSPTISFDKPLRSAGSTAEMLSDLVLQQFDAFLHYVIENPPPHAKVRPATPGPYAYDPWLMPVRRGPQVAPGQFTFTGQTGLAVGHWPLYFERLGNLRAFLKHAANINQGEVS